MLNTPSSLPLSVLGKGRKGGREGGREEEGEEVERQRVDVGTREKEVEEGG